MARYIGPGESIPKPVHKWWLVLSVFDGCGTAHEAADTVLGSHRIWHRISWEIDEECNHISSTRWPDIEQRGDIFADTQDSLRDRIDELDPNKECAILLAAAPPCPDFSRIRPDASGREGPEGQKFDAMLRWFADPAAIFSTRKVLRLIENVIMSRKADLKHFEAEIGVPGIIVDAQDWGVVKRPRVWWSDAGWSQFVDTALGWKIQWTKLYGLDQLSFELPSDKIDTILPDGWKPPKCLAEGKTLPTLTTPAPGPEGRPIPRSVKGKLDSATFHRWELAGKQFAPWHYRPDNLWENDRGELVTPSILLKERMHHLPDNFTAPAQDERSRHKIVANGWHLGTAILLLALLTCFPTAAAQVVQANSTKELQPLGHSALDIITSIWRSAPLACGPDTSDQADHWMTRCTSIDEHWRESHHRQHPAAIAEPLEPGLRQTIKLWLHWHPCLPDIRDRLAVEITTLAVDLEEELQAWHQSRTQNIRTVLNPSGPNRIHFPLLAHLLGRLGWTDTTLLGEIAEGFPVVGRMSPGLGWKKRMDMKYAQPMRFESFLKLNEEHVLSRLHQTKPDPHWQAMLCEISKDIEKNRMIGPLTAPPSWGIRTIPSVHHPNTQRLQDGPSCHVPTSFAFSVEQTGADGLTKVRRCEDWKRSRHNDTVEGEDIPPTHRVNTFIAVANEFRSQGFTTHLWGADHESAYRQLPVSQPDHTHVLVRIPGGWTLWKHRCLLFGSTASVWAYTRTADMICWLCRALTLSPMVHYVDDYASIEPPCTIQSGFDCVHHLMRTIGFKFKPSKDQPPAHEQHIQGVIMTTSGTSFQVSTDPARTQRIVTQLSEYMHRGTMSSDEAHRLAGKLQFISEAMLSQTIRCCIQPLYARAAAPVQHAQIPLGNGIKDALKTILNILPSAHPRVFQFSKPACTIVYADAYFQAGDKKISVRQALERSDWTAEGTHLMRNGWGFVLRKPNQECYYAHGEIPGSLLGKFTSRKAFIYALEIIAQILCLVAGRPHMERASLCFIDNEPGKFALQTKATASIEEAMTLGNRLAESHIGPDITAIWAAHMAEQTPVKLPWHNDPKR